MFSRVLIANRGEIARRIIRACDALGIESVAVHSEADRDAPFVREAGRTVCIGPARPAQSYLNIEAILQAAAQTESQAIHPGYGFLAENALFAQMVLQQRLAWIGPPPRVIRSMGEKSPAKRAMRAAGLPVIPGSDGLLESFEEAEDLARRIGFPVLLKADRGGGGRGMRRADSMDELRSAWNEARAEAMAAFGDDSMYLEKYLTSSRHIEFQLLVDMWGNGVHLFERECSIQRRHQKLLEEAPSTALTDEQRHTMGARVAAAAVAVGYVGAGTVEFLLDPDTGELYFIEMNTRLQVEHPVTEEITGIDLVQAQIRIAAGERLWFTQDDVAIDGHAIEVRVNAEDPDEDFRPTPGRVTAFVLPDADDVARVAGGRLRVDASVDEGSRIPPYYDSMIAKVIGWGPTREAATATTAAALAGMTIEGVKTTISLHQRILAAPDFVAGDLRVGRIPGFGDG
jgi:acetyl-CoA carboxylase biotin carboxylase subunit